MEFETILTEERDGIFIITFNRLEARNAMNNLMTKEIGDALEYWDHNDDLRVCIITNNGHVFCAGSDLKELAAGAYEVPEGREKWGFAAMTKRSFDKPIIAAVHGKALGGGMGDRCRMRSRGCCERFCFRLARAPCWPYGSRWRSSSPPCSADPDEVRHGTHAGRRTHLCAKS